MAHYGQKIYGYFEVENKDGKRFLYDITSLATYKALMESNHVKIEVGEPLEADLGKTIPNQDFISVILNESDVNWTTTTRHVHCCLPRATSDHMVHWFGKKLDNDDEKWYKEYAEKVSSDGCKQAWTITVIEQLVEPYGLGVSRVVVSPDLMRHAEHHTWMGRLGANPFFTSDGKTTNDQALDKMGVLDPEQRKFWKNKWRFETEPNPVGPFISLEQFSPVSSTSAYGRSSIGGNFSSSNTVSSHNGGAHYRGPRARMYSGSFKIAVQLDYAANIDKTNYPKFPLDPYSVDQGVRRPNFDSIKVHQEPAGEDGKVKILTLRMMESAIQAKESAERIARNKSSFSTRGPLTINKHMDKEDEQWWAEFTKEEKDKTVRLTFPPVCESCQRPLTVRWLGSASRCSTCNADVRKNYAAPPFPETLWLD